jgi:hypothetical protein
MRKLLKQTGILLASIVVILIIIFTAVFWNELRSLASIKKLDDHPLLQMAYYGDYGFDKFLENGAKNDHEVAIFVTKRLLRGIPINLNLDLGGCTVFIVKNERGEVLFCRNYDFPYTPAMQVFTSPDNGFRSVATGHLDIFGYTKSYFPSGINLNSLYALATPYAPWDGMNEKGLAIALLAIPEAHGPDDDDKLTLGTTTIIRLVLDKASTVGEAVELMKKYNIYFSAGISCHFLIADASGDSVLVEYWDGELKIVTTPDDFQVASNFIAWNGLNYGEGFNEIERYETVKSRIDKNGGWLSEQQAIDLLTEVGIYYEGVDKLQWTVIYNLTTGIGKIFAGRNTDNIIQFQLSNNGNRKDILKGKG